MMVFTRLAMVTFLVGVSSCAATQVPVLGAPIDVARLTGDWSGAFSSVDTDRHGDIHFRLEAGADTANGHVVMIPHTGHEAMAPIDEPYGEFDERYLAEGLAIQFIEVGSNTVFGELAPYRDPDCGCELKTTFEGEIMGDVIEGTYRSLHIGGGRVVSGLWRVQRRN